MSGPRPTPLLESPGVQAPAPPRPLSRQASGPTRRERTRPEVSAQLYCSGRGARPGLGQVTAAPAPRDLQTTITTPQETHEDAWAPAAEGGAAGSLPPPRFHRAAPPAAGGPDCTRGRGSSSPASLGTGAEPGPWGMAPAQGAGPQGLLAGVVGGGDLGAGGLHAPDLTGVLRDCAVAAELARGCDVADRRTRPLPRVLQHT